MSPLRSYNPLLDLLATQTNQTPVGREVYLPTLLPTSAPGRRSSKPPSPPQARHIQPVQPLNPVQLEPTTPTQPETPQTSTARSVMSSPPPSDSHNGLTDNENKFSAEEDKRRRNTAASARFRAKKKMREQALETKAEEMTAKADALEKRVRELETEVKWLRGLVIEKDPSLLNHPPATGHPSSLVLSSSNSRAVGLGDPYGRSQVISTLTSPLPLAKRAKLSPSNQH